MAAVLTWNVNSIRTRLERLQAVLERHKPDIVCLQELKVTDDLFPLDAMRAAGYHAAIHGQKTYNGVAILSREKPSDIRIGIGDDVDDPQARLASATVGGIRVLSAYFPNGGTVDSDKYEYKLAWMDRVRELLESSYSADERLLLCGDTNIAIDDADVANPDQWADSVLCAGPGRAALRRIMDWGLVDVFRHHHPEGGLYSWWDYRRLGFPRGDGLRIDHILATGPLANACVSATIDREERKGSKPSDHAPVIATFEI